MTQPNTIGTTEARFADGSVIAYCDSDLSHVRQLRFQEIMDKKPLFFSVTMTDGTRLGVNLANGWLQVDDSIYTVPHPEAEHRLIYYKRMHSDVNGHSPVSICDFFVVGWQATIDGKNHKVGLKVYPNEKQWVITEDI